jgi:hypothetical protein
MCSPVERRARAIGVVETANVAGRPIVALVVIAIGEAADVRLGGAVAIRAVRVVETADVRGGVVLRGGRARGGKRGEDDKLFHCVISFQVAELVRRLGRDAPRIEPIGQTILSERAKFVIFQANRTACRATVSSRVPVQRLWSRLRAPGSLIRYSISLMIVEWKRPGGGVASAASDRRFQTFSFGVEAAS